ncbi:MAG: DNA-directed RNA polymerase subunit alpha [Candidatus Eisenbacteria sp.]|nr:DNA-directed RNA polymerase subunit alpha [Candidatus Eisenbacteria bacterium]
MKWKSLTMPKKVEVDEGTLTSTYGKFIAEPLERGFGTTLGNALRRVLLSSLQGAAVTAVRFEGALHEFTTIRGSGEGKDKGSGSTAVLEDVSEIILNLKQMRMKLHADHSRTIRMDIKGPKDITAADFDGDADVEILNHDLHIATLSKGGNLKMEVEIGCGRGYVPAEQQQQAERPIGVIPVDAIFTPVRHVNYTVGDTRVGQRTDYDTLELEIWTDGSISPIDAMSMAARILRDHLAFFVQFEEEPEEEVEEEVDEEVERVQDLLSRSVDELELSVRSSNCLTAASIRTIGELVQKTEQEMLKYRNFGRKSLKEISDILKNMGLHFGMDVSKYFAEEAARAREPEEVKEDALVE